MQCTVFYTGERKSYIEHPVWWCSVESQPTISLSICCSTFSKWKLTPSELRELQNYYGGDSVFSDAN